MYEPIHIDRLYEKIVDQIEEQILKGVLKDGDQLPPERELAESFGVSRTAVREAVKALTHKGLVQVTPGRGTFIKTDTSQALRHSLDLLIKVGQTSGSGDLVEVREIFEPEIAALAAARATEDHIAELNAFVDVMDGALDDAERFIEADLKFHSVLAKATGNALITTLIDSILDLLREQRMRIFQVDGGSKRGQYHHKRILMALVEKNPSAAYKAMREHLQQVREDSDSSHSISS